MRFCITGTATSRECPIYDLSENVSATAREVATLFWLEERSGIDCDMLSGFQKAMVQTGEVLH